MPTDRIHMHHEYRRDRTSLVTWLICAIAGAFLLQFAADSSLLPASSSLIDGLALSREALASGRLWAPLTFWLLHDTTNLFHVGLVLLGLFLVGHEITACLGPRRFAAVFLASLLGGAACWAILHLGSDQTLIGATAGLYGLIAAYALLFPEREIRFLLFFFPVTFRPGQLVFGLLAADIFALVLVDLLVRPLPFAYAPSAHLGGMLAGWLVCRFFHESRRHRATTMRRIGRSLPAKTPVLAGEGGQETTARPVGSSRAGVRAEVDRILDKINSRGLDALTPAERRVLDEAKDALNRP